MDSESNADAVGMDMKKQAQHERHAQVHTRLQEWLERVDLIADRVKHTDRQLVISDVTFSAMRVALGDCFEITVNQSEYPVKI